MNDAIVVLANLMDAKGKLNSETTSRLGGAADLLKAGRAPVIVTCGWAYRPDSPMCIADAMAAHAIAHMGVDPSQVLTETSSRDTVGDAVFTKLRYYNPLGWKNVVVVTSAYHSMRTQEIFSFVYGRRVEVVSAYSEVTEALLESEARSLNIFRGTFAGITAGDDRAIYDRLVERHPFYNGQVYPPIEWPASAPTIV